MFSFLAVVPGLYFRTHYFIVLLPAVSLLAGVGDRPSKLLAAARRYLVVVAFLTTTFCRIVSESNFHIADQVRIMETLHQPYHPQVQRL